MDGWIKHDNTGLKGLANTWAKDNLEENHLNPLITRVKSNEENIKNLSDKCDAFIYGVGFKKR